MQVFARRFAEKLLDQCGEETEFTVTVAPDQMPFVIERLIELGCSVEVDGLKDMLIVRNAKRSEDE